MTLIHYYIHGRGSGHSNTAKVVVKKLVDQGYSVRVFQGYTANTQIIGVESTEMVESIFPEMGFTNWIRVLCHRVIAAHTEMKNDQPAVVLSDGDIPSCIAAKFSGTPSIAIGHGLIFSHCSRPKGLPMLPWWRERAKGMFASLGSRVQIAVSLTNLSPRKSSTVVSGPAIRTETKVKLQDNGQTLCYFRDEDSDHILKWLVDLGENPLLYAAEDPKIPGVEWRPHSFLEFAKSLREAKCVVSSAGSNLIAECAELGLPHFAIYQANDDEQLLNAILFRNAIFRCSAKEDVSLKLLSEFYGSIVNRPRSAVPEKPWRDLPPPEEAILQSINAQIL